MAGSIFNSVTRDESRRALDALAAELAVLRDENAHLRVARQQRESGGSLAQLRAVLALVQARLGTDVTDSLRRDGRGCFDAGEAGHDAGVENRDRSDPDGGDALWQALTDAVVLRALLLDMTGQVTAVAEHLQARLGQLDPPTSTATTSTSTAATLRTPAGCPT